MVFGDRKERTDEFGRILRPRTLGSPKKRSPSPRSKDLVRRYSRSPLKRSPPRRSPLRRSPMRILPRSPPRRSPPRRSPTRRSSPRRSPFRRSPSRQSSSRHSSSRRSPPRSRPWTHSASPERPTTISTRTDIDDPKLLQARVFIGKVPPGITKDEIEEMFSKYGKILGCSVHDKGFAFVQFEKEEHALESVKMENGTLLKGSNLAVKMSAEGRRQAPQRGRGRSPTFERDPAYPERDAAPVRPGVPRERSPLRDPYDRYRDPYTRDPLARDPLARDPLARRPDPYADPYRRPPPIDDPYYDRYREDPYRRDPRDPYADPYRDPYYRDYIPPPPPEAPKRQPADCQIIILNSTLRRYAESVDRRLKNLNLIVEIVLITEDRSVTQMVEDASRKNVLFALVCNSQNEVHQSVTLNILHGTAQEHRNMPIDDAMSLVARSFETYLQSLRDKSQAAPPAATPAIPATPSTEGAPFVPPSADITYLLNLLADNRQLTLEEIDKVITYLTDRREKQFGPPTRRSLPEAEREIRETPIFNPATEQRAVNTNALQQQELQAKILSFLNGSGNTGANPVQPRPGAGLSGVSRAGLPTQQQQQGGNSSMSALINFDNPNVQKALDNLIQSGPNLLKNISSATQSGMTATTKTAPMDAGDGRRVASGFGAPPQLGVPASNRMGAFGLMSRTQGPQTAMRRQF
ncbi:hypothetical protein ScPMuIL_001373 [Solemya velum]